MSLQTPVQINNVAKRHLTNDILEVPLEFENYGNLNGSDLFDNPNIAEYKRLSFTNFNKPTIFLNENCNSDIALNFDAFEKIVYTWAEFSDNMNSENMERLISYLECYLGEDLFNKLLSTKNKLKRFYTDCENPSIIHLRILYLNSRLSDNSSPTSTTSLLSTLFGDSKTELSKLLLTLPINDIQPLLLLLSSHYLRINWNSVCRSMPGISKIYKTCDQDSIYFETLDSQALTSESSKNYLSPKYFIHLNSYWILRDCIYIVFFLIYESRIKDIHHSILDVYCGLLKDLTYKRTLLLTGPKLLKVRNRSIETSGINERCCVTSAIPLLDVLIQFLTKSNEDDSCIQSILSRICPNELLNCSRDSSSLANLKNCADKSFTSDILLTRRPFVSLNYRNFPDFNTSIDILLKGGEFLLVYPLPNIFKRSKKAIESYYLSKIERSENCTSFEKDLIVQLEEYFPKVNLRLSKDLSYLLIHELEDKRTNNIEISPVNTTIKARNKINFKFTIRGRPKRRKIPISSIISSHIGYSIRPDFIPLPSPNIFDSCFCCNHSKFDEVSMFYRTLTIQTKKKTFKFLSVNLNELCIKQWQTIIKQFIEYKFSQIITNGSNSKGIIKITRFKRNKVASNDEMFNPIFIKRKWYEEILPNWGTHWNCNSIPISIYNRISPTNQQLNRHRNDQNSRRCNLKTYLRFISNKNSIEHFHSWFFGSHWLNQNTSLHIFGNKIKITGTKTLPVFKGYSFENLNSMDNGNAVSNWLHFLHYKLNSSYPIYIFPVVDRGIRFDAPNSQLLTDLWSIGIPTNLRHKIWQIALGNEIKVSNELFYIWHLQNMYNIKEFNLNYLKNDLLIRYALEIQSIYYRKREDNDKKFSPYIDRKDRVLNASASSYFSSIFRKPCGFAKNWDYSSNKEELKEKVDPLINIEEYYIDMNCVSISKISDNSGNFENELFEYKNFNFNDKNRQSPSHLNHTNQFNSTGPLNFSSLEALTLTRFIQSHGTPRISVNDSSNQNIDDLNFNEQENESSDSNSTIIKGLLDTLGALLTHSPSIGFQPCIIKYLTVFLMYMEPPNAFKCILNMLSSFEYLANSNSFYYSNNLESLSSEGETSLNYLNKNSVEHFLANSQFINQFNYKNDRIWLLISHIFQSFVYSNFPQLYQHLLYTIGIGFENIVIPWFRNLFMDTLSFPVVLIVWDNFLLLGLPLLFQAGLSILKLCESQLLKCEYTTDALNILLYNCEYNSFVIKPDSFTIALREVQKICDITEITSIVSHYNLLEQKRWILRSQRAIKNFLISQGYYFTSTPNTPKEN